MGIKKHHILHISIISALLAGCNSGGGLESDKPSYIKGDIFVQHYDGGSNDLLTAGVGQTGLTQASPSFADPENPTVEELRRTTIVNQHKALIDTRLRAGFGSLYGPAVASRFAIPTNDGKVAGKEYLTYADDGTGQQNVTLMVQIPDSFNKGRPCIITAPSSGSRGIYGAVGTAGEWGLKNHCAVAYTDKGTGNGVHDLSTDTVNDIRGVRGQAATLGNNANFIAKGSDSTSLASYVANNPNRIAQKHAHSQQNPEADWGWNVLQSLEFAFYVLNLDENLELRNNIFNKFNAGNTLVIASSISNGGGASLRAAEQDNLGLIDGVVVVEPNINPKALAVSDSFTIQQGSVVYPPEVHSKPLLDYLTYYNVYQPCASAGKNLAFGFDPALGEPTTGAFPAGVKGRCTALKAQGLLTSDTLEAQITEAQAKINAYGVVPSSNITAYTFGAFAGNASIANLYANAYGRFSVVDNLCGFSYAAVAKRGSPRPKVLSDLADDFSSGNGIPPSSETALVNNAGLNGEGQDFKSVPNADGVIDESLEGALCLRSLATGKTASGDSLTGDMLDKYKRVQLGLSAILGTGNLRSKPTIIVHGRDDSLINVNHASRAYYGLNKKTRGNDSKLVYVEVKHANHLDAFNQIFNIDTQIPIHYYLGEALDEMFDHLANGAALPESQVIATKTLASTGGDKLTEAHLPKIGAAENCRINFTDNRLTIPDC